VEEFIVFARDHRGLRSTTTFEAQREHVGAFLSSLGDRATAAGLRSLAPADIRRFLVRHCEGLTRSGRLHTCSAVRAFLRFARIRGYLARDLVDAEPVIPRYRLDRVPTVLAWEDIRRPIPSASRSGSAIATCSPGSRLCDRLGYVTAQALVTREPVVAVEHCAPPALLGHITVLVT
jgi:hypothetical protein